MVRKPATLAELSNIFRPEALTEEEYDLYQPTAAVRGGMQDEFHMYLYERIKSSRDKAHLLVVGHSGCGKSTELRMLALRLGKDGVPSITIDAQEDLDLNTFSFIDLFILVVERLVQYANANRLNINKGILTAFYMALSTRTTREYWEKELGASLESGASVSVSVPLFIQVVSKITASFKVGSGQREDLRREIKPKMAEIINAVNALIDQINCQVAQDGHSGKILIVVDGLEKCRSENAKQLFSEDIGSLAAINTHLVVACPINIYRSAIAATLQGYFPKPDLMPLIKTRTPDSADSPYRKGIGIIKELVLKRADASFFQKGVLSKIIAMAGGNLRDTLYLLENSAFEAHMRRRDTIDMASAEFAMNQFATDLFFRTDNNYHKLINSIYNGDQRPRADKDMSELLFAGIVFEYNGERWIDLHPLIRRFIDRNPGVLILE
ncbi:MAG: ATP-binding protein [Clostridiales bacterium]|nr:ATP-binding protein [Clostridiales bacterium]